jgi:isopenicillin-N N-acyltransferase-like protein
VRELGLAAFGHISAVVPELAEEIDGIARGAQLPLHRVAALNARTEILGRFGLQHPECSTVVHAPTDGTPPVTTQTWDWHEEMRDGWFVWHIEHPDGREVRTVTEYGIVGKIGVNAAGLGLHFNILAHATDGPAPRADTLWLPVHVLARHVLDRCDSLDEAVEMATATPVAASSAITLAAYESGQAQAATVELSPVGAAVLHPGVDGYLLHTNHFVDPRLASGEALATEDPDTLHRFAALHARTADRPAPGAPALLDALTFHLDEGAALCCHPDPDAAPGERWETLATVSLDVTNVRLAVHAGGPCTALDTDWTLV